MNQEHIDNENLDDKADLVRDVLALPNVNADLLVHDDCCHFETFVQRTDPETYKNIKYWVIDKFHRCNHKCSKRIWAMRETRRMNGVPSSMSEIFNSWVRQLNFFLNSLNPMSHRFWVEELILFYNKRTAGRLDRPVSARSNAASRAKA